MPTETGTIVVITIPGKLPSINKYIAAVRLNRLRGSDFEREWRRLGEFVANNFLNELEPEQMLKTYPLKAGQIERLVIKVWRKTRQLCDIHNLYVKPVLDGFTDGGLWEEDNERVIPSVTLEYAGVDKENPRVEFNLILKEAGGNGDGNQQR